MKLNRQVEYLFELSKQRDSEGREELYLCVADLFSRQNAVLSRPERDLMREILWNLTREVELAVRNKLAESLADDPDAPKDLLTLLVDDRIEVARPILMRSEVLKSADLIEIIRHKSQAYQLAVAARENLAEDVSDALVETGDESVILRLIGNKSARISEDTLTRIAEASKDIEAFQKPLLERSDLPPQIAKHMYTWVSAALRQYIVNTFDVDVDDLDDALAGTVAKLETESTAADSGDHPVILLVKALAAGNALDQAFLMRALGQARVAIFEHAFAEMLGLDVRMTRQLLYDPGWENLAIACKALEFTTETFCIIQGNTAKTRQVMDEYSDISADTPRRFYESLNAEDSAGVLRRWRRDADFTSAVGTFSNL